MHPSEELRDNGIETILYPKYIQAAHVLVTWQDKVLLVHRLPGGHVETGETYYAAALRELDEETGIKAVSLQPVVIYLTHQHKFEVHLFHTASQDGSFSHLEPEEHTEVAWKTLESAQKLDLTPGLPLILGRLKQFHD